MDVVEELLRDIPHDAQAAFVLADYLEERGDPACAELLRLVYTLTRAIDVPGRLWMEERLRALLARGVRPVGPYEAVALAPGVELVLAWVPPGTFLMGSPPDEAGRGDDEDQHRVTLTRGFCLGVYPVTQAQWRAVMGTNPSRFKGDDRPVERVSWEDCQRFCQQLSDREGEPYGLPTEAEWEYACRAGTTTTFHFGPRTSTGLANYDGKDTAGRGTEGACRDQTTPVGSFTANAWGLYDMHGNVCEWCQDAYGPYPKSRIEGRKSSSNVGGRVLRGGSWFNPARHCRAADRLRAAPGARIDSVGFRVCLRPD